MVIGISGARSLSPATLAQVRTFAASVTASGGIVYTGCAVGADAAAIAGTLDNNYGLLHVYAVGNRIGQGFPRPNMPQHMRGIETYDNVILRWLAGGPLTLPLVARLARRSLAMVRAVAAADGSLVAFPASGCPPRAFGPGPFPSCGSGTWATVGAAALLGVPVFVIMPGGTNTTRVLQHLAALPVAGTWAQASLFGVAGWAFVPAQAKAF